MARAGWQAPSPYFALVWLTCGSQVLEHIVYYVFPAPHDNEQSDMPHLLYNDPALPKLELHWCVDSCYRILADVFILSNLEICSSSLSILNSTTSSFSFGTEPPSSIFTSGKPSSSVGSQ